MSRSVIALASTPPRPTRRQIRHRAAPISLRLHAPAPTPQDLRDSLRLDMIDLVADAIDGERSGRDWAPAIERRIRAIAAAAAPIPA